MTSWFVNINNVKYNELKQLQIGKSLVKVIC